jgi:Flp pilus assembly pilin Flp
MRWHREHRVLRTGRDRLAGEQGPALVEYALILGVVAVLTIGVLQALGVSVSGVLNRVSTSISSVPNP